MARPTAKGQNGRHHARSARVIDEALGVSFPPEDLACAATWAPLVQTPRGQTRGETEAALLFSAYPGYG
jgi:hypothetical protein